MTRGRARRLPYRRVGRGVVAHAGEVGAHGDDGDHGSGRAMLAATRRSRTHHKDGGGLIQGKLRVFL
jgi:hypothetical protein